MVQAQRQKYRSIEQNRKPRDGGSDGKACVYNVGDPGSIPGLGRSPGEEMATHASILGWEYSWTEEPGDL